MKRKMNNKGFTLVELIVVMAIMAILVGALAPQVIKYVEKARETKDLQVESTLFTAVQTAITSSEDTVPSFSGATLATLSTIGVDAVEDAILAKIHTEVVSLSGLADDAAVTAACKSNKKGAVSITYVSTTGKITVKIGTLEAVTN